MIETQPRPERAFLLGVLLPGTDPAALEAQMQELRELVSTAGAEVVGTDVQRRTEIDPALFVGRGKVSDLKDQRAGAGYDVLICNEDLSPRQQRNLERPLEARVLDRTEVILEIFAQHARTREGRLQVEAARLHHWLPRLVGAYDVNRQMGGIGGRGGPGEQQIEIERRRVRRRLRDLESQLEQVRTQRDQQRAERRGSDLVTVAIVGYTNAGKSTLLNALTNAGVRAEDQLFATLDPTTRRYRVPNGRELLLSDTVGFIQKLPTDLIAAFRSTLEEVTYADVVLQVVDATAAAAATAADEQADTVDGVLRDLQAGDTPRVVALNKIDRLDPAARRRALERLSQRYRTVVPISALRGTGLDELGEALATAGSSDLVPMELLVPYGRERILAELHREGVVDETRYTERGTRARGRAPRQAVHRFQPYVVG